MNTELMFSSKEIQWGTPSELFDEWNKEFNFTLDPCSQIDTAKCTKFYTPKENGLIQNWQGEVVFVNPPYNKPEEICKKNCKKKTCENRGYHITKRIPGQVDWIKKASDESKKTNTTVVMLLPARTDTIMFHKYIYKIENDINVLSEIRFLKGRIKFIDPKTKLPGDAAPFPSMLVIFRGKNNY